MKAKTKTNDIKVTPVKKYAPPKYPTRADAQCAPLLLRKLPSRWEKNAAVVAAVGMIGAMTLTSCGIQKQDFAGQEQDTICEETCGTDDMTYDIFTLTGEPTTPYTNTTMLEGTNVPAVFTSEQEIEEEYFELMGEPAIVEFTTEQEFALDTGELAGDVIFEIPSEQDYVELEETTMFIPESKKNLNVAPIFIHGEGTGGIGCMSVAPPSFLSEQEALAIIINMAEAAGINFNAAPPDYVATNNNLYIEEGWADWVPAENRKIVLGNGNVGLDLFDSDKKIAVTYIDMYSAEEQMPTRTTVAKLLPLELAKLTAEDFARQKGDFTIGVFYDPGIDWNNEEQQKLIYEYEKKIIEIYNEYDIENPDEYWKKRDEVWVEYSSKIKPFAEAELRRQVYDFIKWLNAQKIIIDEFPYLYAYEFEAPKPMLTGTSGPPSFLSEEDALAIIKNMAESEGLNFKSDMSQNSKYSQDIILYDKKIKFRLHITDGMILWKRQEEIMLTQTELYQGRFTILKTGTI